MSKTRYDHIRNRLPLVGVVFILTYLLFLLIDKSYAAWLLQSDTTLADYVMDATCTLLASFILVEWSVFYSSWWFRHLPFTLASYKKLIANSFLLLLFNNLTAWLFTSLGVWLSDENSFFPQGLYITTVIATFVSFLYTNARYLESFILVEKQKKELEINLLREKEHAAQMQFEVLKAQINPHFMFNNFSVLSELIMEDPLLADKFLENLSNVYRYVIQNLKHDIVDLRDEIKLLYSYIYLIKIRYEDAIHIDIDETLEQTAGQIPPMSLQLLVENAIKHNQFSADHPLSIHIFHEERYIVVENELRPLASELASTGIGHHNLTERYFLLCRATPVIEKREDTYIVKLPIIHDIHHEHIDYRR